MRMLVVGAGATGGYFGGRLAQAGRDVTFLVRSARAAQLRAEGLRIESPHGNATLQPQVALAGEITGPFDAVLLTVKGFGLDTAMTDLAPAVGPDTLIVPVLNGMRHLDALARRFRPHNVVGGVCKVATTLDEAGVVRQLAPLQDLAYGELDGSRTPRMQALDAGMQGAGFTARLSTDIQQEMWEKWVMLAAMGGVTCLMRGHLGEVASAPGGIALAHALLAECTATAAAAGYPPRASFLEATSKMFANPSSTQAPSMYRDLQKGYQLEADPILGDMVARAAVHGVATPLLGAAYAQLTIQERRRVRA